MTWAATAQFYDSFRRMLQAGFSIPEALERSTDETKGPYKIWAAQWAVACRNGEPLAEQLPDAYPLAKALVSAGERSGQLPELCKNITAYYELCVQQKRNMIGRSLYPIFLIHFATIVPVGAFSISGALPAWAPLLGPILFWATVLLGFALYRGLRNTALFHAWCLKFPIGTVSLPMNTTMICKVLEACLIAGMQYPEAFRQAAAVTGNMHLKNALEKGAASIESSDADNFTSVMKSMPLHKHVLDMCASGEKSGTLEESLARAGTLESERFESALKWAIKIINGTIYTIAIIVAVIVIFSAFSSYIGVLNGIKGPLG